MFHVLFVIFSLSEKPKVNPLALAMPWWNQIPTIRFVVENSSSFVFTRISGGILRIFIFYIFLLLIGLELTVLSFVIVLSITIVIHVYTLSSVSMTLLEVENDDDGGAKRIDNPIPIVEELSPSKPMVVDESTEPAMIKEPLIFEKLAVAATTVPAVSELISRESFKGLVKGLP